MRRCLFFVLVLFTLTSCGRPLTSDEQQFMYGLQGESFDPAPVRISRNRLVGIAKRTYPVRPRTTCRERILPPSEEPTFTARTAGIVWFQHLNTSPRFYLDDYVARPDGALNLVAAMYFAHEMTHVWQWQNRAVTGYHPFRAFAEQLAADDPYLFDSESEHRFLDYGYEQQASLVEEYVCCRALDPDGARTGRLERLLRQEMPVSPALDHIDGLEVVVPWDGTNFKGICS